MPNNKKKIFVQIAGRKHPLTRQQIARIYAQAPEVLGMGTETGSEAPQAPARVSAPSGPRVGDLVAASMPRHPRVLISRIHSFDADGEARGARGEHLGYLNRRDSRGRSKYTLLTSLTSGPLAETLRESFPNLNNPAQPSRR